MKDQGMDLSDRQYIEIIVLPGETGEKSLDTLEYALALCVYHSSTNVMVNLQEINHYDIMLLTPFSSLITEMQSQGLSISICAPPTIFTQEFNELYANTGIDLYSDSKIFLETGASIGVTITDTDGAMQSTITQYALHHASKYKEQNESIRQEADQEAEVPTDPETPEPNEHHDVRAEEKKESPRLLIPEIIDSNVSFSYFDQNKNIEICILSGEYECIECAAKEYFMKGFPFDSCNTKSCRGSSPSWKLIKKVF